MAGDSYLSRSSIRSHQLEQLRLLLGQLPANRFYASKFTAAKLELGSVTLADFTERFPFTTKQELASDQQAHPPYGCNLTFPIDQYTRCHQTSGTSGTALRWLDTPESWDWMVQNWMEVYRAAGVGKSDRVFFAFSFGPFIGFWLAFEAAAQLGCLCLPGGGLSSAARLKNLLTHQTTVLCCTPTYAIRLAEVASEENIDRSGSKVRRLIVAGEPGGSIPATRARLEQLWPGARVFDHHGMTEVGPVTYECPARPCVLHVMETAYLAEIVDPSTGQPVPAGQTGELILTTLGRNGSPLLRYRTGDLVKTDLQSDGKAPGAPCACGRYDLTLVGGILGRSDDMVVIRGVNVFPSAIEEIVRKHPEVAEYRVTVEQKEALPELKIEIEPDPALQDVESLRATLERAFQDGFALRIPVQVTPPGTLPRFELKAKRWILRHA